MIRNRVTDEISGSTWATVPEDHGAAGDGTTNDTVALQAWLDDPRPFKILPANTYITDYLDVPANVSIVGGGEDSCLKLRGQTITVMGGVLNIAGTSGDPISGVVVSDLRVDGNKANVTPSGSGVPLNVECVNVEHAVGIRIVNVTVHDAVADGIDTDFTEHSVIVGCIARDCDGWGIHISAGSFENRVIGNMAEGCGTVHSRGGIDQYGIGGNPAGRNIYIGNTCRDNYRNWDIRAASEADGATWIGNQSYNGANADILTGVADFGGTGVDVSDDAPQDVGTTAAGTSADASRSDHVHALSGSAVRDAGRWEVIVSGTAPPVAVTNEAEDDWIYGWVDD